MNIIYCTTTALSASTLLLLYYLAKLLLLLLLLLFTFFFAKCLFPSSQPFMLFLLHFPINNPLRHMKTVVHINTGSIFSYNFDLFYFYPKSEYTNIRARFAQCLSQSWKALGWPVKDESRMKRYTKKISAGARLCLERIKSLSWYYY